MHEKLEERVAVPGCTSRRLCAVESGMLLAQMPEESVEMGKRAPSSFEDGLACVVVVSGGCRLLCPVDDAYWVFCLYPVVGEHLQHLNSCCDAEYAIVSSAGGLGVEVRAGKCEWGVVTEAWSHGEDIAHGIDGSMAVQCLNCLDEPVSSLLVGVGEGQAAHACFGKCALRREQYVGYVIIFRHIFKNIEAFQIYYQKSRGLGVAV